VIRWNFSSRAKELSGGDAIVISIPKSGRTWVRTFLCAYYCRRYGHEFTLQPEQYGDSRIPRIVFTHDLFEHRTKGSMWDWLRGKYLVPSKELRRARVVLLVRDPRDCFVSLYVQMTRRTAETPASLREQSISELLRDHRFGIRAIIETMNKWMKMFAGRQDFQIVRYESLRTAPAESFRRLLLGLGDTAPDMSLLAEALEFSRFENMQQMEAAGAFDSKILQPGDAGDPESFKVRRGKVGGFEEYLSADDQQFAAELMRKLDARLGYVSEVAAR
jgi:hypothetical protein